MSDQSPSPTVPDNQGGCGTTGCDIGVAHPRSWHTSTPGGGGTTWPPVVPDNAGLARAFWEAWMAAAGDDSAYQAQAGIDAVLASLGLTVVDGSAGTVTVRAGDLSGRHVGMLTTLPGQLDHATGTWVDTTAPVTMVQHCKDGRVKVRRHPDSHVDHLFRPDEIVTLVLAL